ncbi:hypothetical protein [Kitasatospora sp. NBC_01300]|uniref:hypothetical protein n=1 Tax=Kitasatospora sp. NBC_01300 TaxID=2903574 RepID=UPI00352DFED2|nr:hypothetical protein OG556_09745 [Kitasatospora sp. NBC_01300]
MTDQHNTAPAVWDPTARGGAGGWVRGPQRPAEPTPAQPAPAQPAAPQDGAALPPAAGAVGDQGPPLVARPYLAAPKPPSVPPPAPFPSHASAQTPGPGYVSGEVPGPGYVYPPQPPAGPQQPPYVPYQGQPDYPADHPSAYPAGYEDPDDEDRPNNRKAPLLIGFALLLVVAVGGGLLVAARNSGDKKDQAAPAPPSASATSTGNPPTGPATGTDATPNGAGDPASSAPAPSPTASGAGANAKTQAQALDGLLTEGESAKAPIGSAVAKVSSCPAKADIESAAQVFDNGAKQRDELLRKLAKLNASDVPGGADAMASLKSAWQLSADIDRAYANWARAVAGQGCSGSAPTTADKKRADELNPQATQAKKDFAGKWKPIADTYGLTPRTQDRI